MSTAPEENVPREGSEITFNQIKKGWTVEITLKGGGKTLVGYVEDIYLDGRPPNPQAVSSIHLLTREYECFVFSEQAVEVPQNAFIAERIVFKSSTKRPE